MNMGPTFLLRPCPICSHRTGDFERPIWKIAHRTTEREGRNHYMWTGCKHARAVGNDTPTADEETFRKTEAAWNASLPALFAEKTNGWNSGARAEFARRLEDRPYAFELPTHSATATHEPPNTEGVESAPII